MKFFLTRSHQATKKRNFQKNTLLFLSVAIPLPKRRQRANKPYFIWKTGKSGKIRCLRPCKLKIEYRILNIQHSKYLSSSPRPLWPFPSQNASNGPKMPFLAVFRPKIDVFDHFQAIFYLENRKIRKNPLSQALAWTVHQFSNTHFSMPGNGGRCSVIAETAAATERRPPNTQYITSKRDAHQPRQLMNHSDRMANHPEKSKIGQKRKTTHTKPPRHQVSK